MKLTAFCDQKWAQNRLGGQVPVVIRWRQEIFSSSITWYIKFTFGSTCFTNSRTTVQCVRHRTLSLKDISISKRLPLHHLNQFSMWYRNKYKRQRLVETWLSHPWVWSVHAQINGLGYRCNSGDLTKMIRGSDRNLRSYLLKALTIYVGQVPEHSCGVRQPKRGDMKVAMGISPLRYLVAEFSNVLEFLDMGRVLWWWLVDELARNYDPWLVSLV